MPKFQNNLVVLLKPKYISFIQYVCAILFSFPTFVNMALVEIFQTVKKINVNISLYDIHMYNIILKYLANF